MYEQPPPENENIRAAAEFIDRQRIEDEAWKLINQRNTLPSIEVKQQERQDNARTALMEALTASGHLSRVEIHGTLEEINAQVLNRLLNGWDESLPAHEKARRFAELCNELIIQKVHRAIVDGLMSSDTEVGEISDYPEALRGFLLGYRDSNEKGMTRSTRLVHNGGGLYTRVIEQVSRSKGTWASSFGFLNACGIATRQKVPDVAVLEAPFLYTRQDYASGVVDIMRLLDRHSGLGVRFGDRGEKLAHHPSYERLREESARREEEIMDFVDNLANLKEQLDGWVAAGTMPRSERTQIFQEEVYRILDAICTLEPSYAEDTFGAASASVFQEAAILEAQGRHEEAQSLLESNNYLKQTVTFCGVSIPVEKAQEMGLKVNSYGQLVEKGKESWKWKQGVCVVKACPTRPGKTEVGPCSVCRQCQANFDHPIKSLLSSTKKLQKTGS